MSMTRIIVPVVLILVVILSLKLMGIFEGPAPVISGIVADNITDSSATITWTTDKPTISQVEYGTIGSGYLATPSDAQLTTNHNITLSGLQPSTTYYWRVRAKDAKGKESISEDMAFTTLAPPKIAFVSDRDGNDEIYVMDADGSNLTRLTNNPAIDDSPAWSPDGTKIAFVSYRDGNEEIYIVDADGSSQTRLTDNSASDCFPSWSPDGTKIAFSSDRDGNDEIYVVDADGSSQTRLTDNSADDDQPEWSPR